MEKRVRIFLCLHKFLTGTALNKVHFAEEDGTANKFNIFMPIDANATEDKEQKLSSYEKPEIIMEVVPPYPIFSLN